MTDNPLPKVARENLRRMTLHIKAILPSATDIDYPKHRVFGTLWHTVEFLNEGKGGLCAISQIDDRCILSWPTVHLETEGGGAMLSNPMEAGTAKILAEYPEATDIQMKGRMHLYFIFMHNGHRGTYTPAYRENPESLEWPASVMTPPSFESKQDIEESDYQNFETAKSARKF